MPSKGIQLYTYIGVQGCQVEYSAPGSTISRNQFDSWFNDHLEVDKAKISGPFNFVGRFTLTVKRNGALITSQWVDINSLTGNLVRGTLKDMEDQKSVITNDIIVTFGLYDAGTGQAGLPKSDQCWVTVTPNRANWMGAVAAPGSAQAAKPFSKLVIPAAHDIGMNSMQNVEAVINHAAKPFMSILKGVDGIVNAISGSMTDEVLAGLAPNIIRGLAITQKDTLNDILTVGARYFEFRPAHLHKVLLPYSPLADKLYFQHGPIPGMSFEQFLHDCVAFLLSHPTEIIVTQLRWDGVPAECARPGDSDIADYLSAALGASKGSIIVGSVDDMQRLTIEQLRSQRKRLILFKSIDSYSTYTDAGNATLNGDSIVAQFEQLSAGNQNGKAFTNLQCQATATNIKDVVIYSVMTANVSNSCLLATKSICDSKTLPWIRRNALGRLTKEQLVVIMNDFFDGFTSETAIKLSQTRLG